MSSLPHELGKEGVLLLYLADELSAQDRAEVEQHLLRDPEMRVELERLREAQESVQLGLTSLDDATPLAASEASALRSVSRVLRERLARSPAAAAVEAPARRPLRVPRWAPKVAAAAAVAVVVVAVGMKMAERDRGGDDRVGIGADDLEFLDPLDQTVVDTLSREVMVGDSAPGEAFEVALVSPDEGPLFDIPLSAPPESELPQP